MKVSKEQLLVDETLYFTGNGYIGIRGNFEEGYPKGYDSVRGSYINGFYENVDITYGESAYGFPKSGQKMANVSDAQTIELSFGEEKFSVFTGNLVDMTRNLDIKTGIYTRNVVWKSPKGYNFTIKFQRLTSFHMLELALFKVLVSSPDYSGNVTFTSKVNGNVTNYTNPDDPRVASGHAKLMDLVDYSYTDHLVQIVDRTRRSKLDMCISAGHNLHADVAYHKGEYVSVIHKNMKPGQVISLEKYVVYTDSIRHKEPADQGRHLLIEAMENSFDYYVEKQVQYLDDFWNFSGIKVEGQPKIEEALNYSVYQLLASAGKDPDSNICAKGLSGEGYEGHYFWDTEVYMLPFFTLTNPKIAKNLLKFRYTHLEASKDRAREMGHKIGAKIPWRTISGTECSGYFPAGSAQYHINADVAFAYIQYYLLHEDDQFMMDCGFEVLLETGRIWLDMGHFTDEGDFMIHDVTGPDEYTAIVNNNYYTNAMAAYHLSWISKLATKLSSRDPDGFKGLKVRLGLTDKELELMIQASLNMYYEYDHKLGVYMQDDTFRSKPVWDFAATPKDKYPLLLNYHPLTIYRHKVLKQADALLAMLLLDHVSLDVFERSYDYYEPLTTHDSSLSPCVYSMAAARIGRSEKALEFFKETIRLDLDNLHGNTRDGLHIANAGGAYMAVVYGFGGLRIKEDGLHLNPHKPIDLPRIDFNVNRRGNLVKISLAENIHVSVEEPMVLWIYNNKYQVDSVLEVDYV